MATTQHKNVRGFRVGIAFAHARAEVVGPLVTGTMNALIEKGVARRDIVFLKVLRPYDLPFAAKRLIESEGNSLDGVVCLGLLVRDELEDKFDFQSEAVAQGIMKLNLKGKVPVVYGVLTCMNSEQSTKFIGEGEGVSADRGWEWAKAVLELIRLSKSIDSDTEVAP
jgi:6,7-dimethyl-8-ribityllumazine synthase